MIRSSASRRGTKYEIKIHKHQKVFHIGNVTRALQATSVEINTEWRLFMASISEDNGEETPLQDFTISVHNIQLCDITRVPNGNDNGSEPVSGYQQPATSGEGGDCRPSGGDLLYCRVYKTSEGYKPWAAISCLNKFSD
ncbi:hypothetical protein Tco_1388453 [Tanacetum coccineum]